MAESINPMDLLKEEMENDDIALRINAIHRLRVIATLLGPEGIKSQLLPYLDNLIKKEDDEVLFAIAEELGNISHFLGAGVTVLLPFLETLASVEETVVRDQAVKALQIVAAQLTDSDIIYSFIPLILKLASGEWFTSRVSAVNLIPSIYTRAGNQKINLKQKFIELCGEETPMVRRAVAMRIGDLASQVEKDVLHELIAIFKQLTGDEQDSVKMLCLESLKQIAKILNKDENKTHIIPVIIGAAEDKSWRVRQAVSKNFSQIAEALGKEVTDYHLIQNFTTVLRDAEVDVRHVAVNSLARLLTLSLLSQEKLLSLIPHIQALARDSNAIVKVGITQVLINLVPQVGKEAAMQKLFPNALELIEDEDSEVKIEGFKTIPKFAQILGTDLLPTLVPHLKNLMLSLKWRVRIAVLECVIELALMFQNYDIFTKQLEPLALVFLNDKACSVREMGIKRIPELITTYKAEWLNGSLMPKLLDLMNKSDANYLQKITVMYSFKSVAQVMPADYISDKIVPHLLKCGKDGVPNLRFVVVKVIKGIIPRLEGAVGPLKGLLLELQNDSDKDVQFYAQETLAMI